MAAIRLIAGIRREVWRDNVPQTEGQVRIITTGIRASNAILSRVDARLYLTNGSGVLNFTGVLSVVSGYLIVSIINNSTFTSSATYTLDVSILHSLMQSPGTTPNIVEVLADPITSNNVMFGTEDAPDPATVPEGTIYYQIE